MTVGKTSGDVAEVVYCTNCSVEELILMQENETMIHILNCNTLGFMW